jgi:hypothetical protein
MRRVRPGVTFHANKGPISSIEKLEHRDEADSEDIDNIVIQLSRSIAQTKSRLRAKDDLTKAPSKLDSGSYKMLTESPRSEVLGKNAEDSYEPTSGEVFEDVLRKLQRLGERGKRVLRRLNKQMNHITPGQGQYEWTILKKVVSEMLREQDGGSNNMSEAQLRSRREIALGSPSLQESLNMNAEEENAANEEVGENLGQAVLGILESLSSHG